MKIEKSVFGTLRYKIAYPENFDKNKKYPVLFFMHGAGERGDNMDLLDIHGVFYEIKKGREFDFICIAPQCEADLVWFDKLPFVKKFFFAFFKILSLTLATFCFRELVWADICLGNF